MALISQYLVTTKNIEPFFNSLTTARAPETFTHKFLQGLEFKTTNDRLYIGLLKGLDFIDENSTPTQRYYDFLDQTKSKEILAVAIEEAYSDLFSVNIKAYEMPVEDVKNKFRTLTQGKPSDNVLALMANTFVALSNYADWKKAKPTKPVVEKLDEKSPIKNSDKNEHQDNTSENDGKNKKMNLHYNIQIHLPASRDQATYDAIFKSLKSHLF